MTAAIPHIHLLCMNPSAADAFERALASRSHSHSPAPAPAPPSFSYTVHGGRLADLPASLAFDLVVSPANSYGILDGGFDDAISRALSRGDDYGALTRAAQRELHRRHRGFLPPGACCLVRVPERFRGSMRYHDGRGWGCRYLALCPTMRVPMACGWDRDVVYECVWSLLNAIENHNNDDGGGGGTGGGASAGGHGGGGDWKAIESILMTPLGTGAGGISEDKWAKQAVLAIKHWIEAKQDPAKWSAIGWREAQKINQELLETYRA